MFRKTFFVLTVPLLACFFASCSLLNSPDESGSVKLSFPARSITGLSEEYENLLIDVSLKGDYTQSKTISAKADSDVIFDQLKIGSKVYIEANAYESFGHDSNEPALEHKHLLFKGTSEEFEITAGEQSVSVTLKKLYTVWFDPRCNQEGFEQFVVSGDKATEPEAPKREATEDCTYTFEGWYTSVFNGETFIEGEPFDFNMPIKSDITLVAKWTEIKTKKCTVNFMADDKKFYTTEVFAGGTISAPASSPEKAKTDDEIYTFDGWYTAEGTAYNFETPISDDLTLFAHYAVTHIYIVSFNLNGGKGTIEAQRVTEGEKATRPSTTPTRDSTETADYTFGGWFTSADEGKTLSETPFEFEKTKITKDIVLYAGWKASAAGTVEVEIPVDAPETIDVDYDYAENGSYTFTASVDETDEDYVWSFIWLFDGTKTGEEKSFTVTSDMLTGTGERYYSVALLATRTKVSDGTKQNYSYKADIKIN